MIRAVRTAVRRARAKVEGTRERLARDWDAHGGNVAAGLLVAMLVSLPLSTSLQEVSCALGLAVVTLERTARGGTARSPLFGPTIVAAIVWAVAPAAGGAVREGIGHAWLLAPLVVVPGLVARAGSTDEAGAAQRAVRLGLHAAAAAAAWALFQRASGGIARGAFSHHLTLAYALLPALAGAVQARRWPHAATLAAGIAATGSSGALVALPVAVLGARTPRPATRLVVATVLTIIGLVFADADELGQRAILWTGGLTVAARGPVGPGGYAAASAPIYDALRPGFWFPNHAHDAPIELLATVGWPGLVAMAGLIVAALRLWRRAPIGTAGLAAVLVGGWTQDVLGDLEVARAIWAWLALDLARSTATAPADPPANA